MTKKSSTLSSFFLFLMGLGSETQIYLFGCIAISELVAFLIAPLLFVKHYSAMRRLGFTAFLNMVILLMGSLFASSWYNHTAFPFVFKSFASIYSVWAHFVVFYTLLKNDLKGIRWVLIGAFLSSIITIFAFNPTANVSESGFAYIDNMETDEVVEGALFWVGKFKALMQIPVCGFYLDFPLVASLLVPFGYIAIALATTVSGRAASVALLISGAMIVIGRKRRSTMASIGKYFFIYFSIGIIMLFVIKQIYVFAAKNGYLSTEAQIKYEQQSKQGTGLLALLMHGRVGFFAAIPAALDRPLMGYGPNAEDIGGYAERFVLKYGDVEDIARLYHIQRRAFMVGVRRPIPTHSYIMGAWVHYGIGGLIFYVWVLVLIVRHIKLYMAAIPQWYGYFAMMLPYYLWNIFFSPFGYRWQFAMLMVCLFFARAVSRGLMPLPIEMLREIKQHEH